MSMILDALKRADQDSAGEPSASVSPGAIVYEKPGLSTLWASVIVLLGLVVAVMGYLLFAREGEDPAGSTVQPTGAIPQAISGRQGGTDQTVINARADITRAQPKQVTLSSRTNPSLTPSASSSSGLSPLSAAQERARLPKPGTGENRLFDDGVADAAVLDLYSQGSQDDTEPVLDDAAATGSRANVRVDAVEDVVQQPPLAVAGSTEDNEFGLESAGASNQPIEESPVDLEAVLRQAQAEWGEPALIPHPVALLESLSQQRKDRIPSVIYSVHDWQSEGRASVVINGKRMAAGQREGGFLVREILKDSVILSWGGTDFRLRALNSWINL